MSVDISKLNSALIIICGVVLFIITLLIFFIVLLRKRHNYYLKEKELLKAQFEKVLLQSQLEIQEQSFTQISAEIHDNIGQVLSLVRLNLNTKGFPENADKLHFTDELLGKAIADLRSLSHNLNAEHILKEGFYESVAFLLKSLEQTKLFKTSLKCDDHMSDIGDDKILILFRMVQEAITNIIKHAEASRIWVEIKSLENGNKQICITDDGKGMDNNRPSNGIGLRNMYHRGNMIDASLNIEKNRLGGTSVIITI